MCTRAKLGAVAKAEALKPFHGVLPGEKSNLQPIVDLFPKWNMEQADGNWCAGFVYYCCVKAGFVFPYSPGECVSCSLAGCGGWEDFATGNEKIECHRNREAGFVPEAGDIVVYDRVFIDREHDHIGIVLENRRDTILAAEGNTFHDNISRVLERRKDGHIREYIRIPNGFIYESSAPDGAVPD